MGKFLLLLCALVCVTASSASAKNSLTLYFYPSPTGVNWETPGSLINSVIRNSIYRASYAPSYRYFIGHVSIGVACKLSDGTEVAFHTGMHNKNKGEFLDYTNLLLRKNVGLDIIFYSFPGRLQTTEELDEKLDLQLRKGTVSFVKFLISQSACERVVRYVKEYQTLGYDQAYGLKNRPLYREGAGCSAFGASFLQVAGIYDGEMDVAWTKTIRVPLSLIGTEENPVSIKAVMDAKRWATEEEPHKTLTVWDPDSMHQWVLNMWQKETKEKRGFYMVQKKGKVFGLLQDRTTWPTPTGDIWLTPLDPFRPLNPVPEPGPVLVQ